MSCKKKSWHEKLADKKDLPKVLKLEKRFPCYNAVHKMGAEETLNENKNLKVPYWRTLKEDGYLNEKYPGGIESYARLLEKGGLRIIKKGKKVFVENYRIFLVNS